HSRESGIQRDTALPRPGSPFSRDDEGWTGSGLRTAALAAGPQIRPAYARAASTALRPASLHGAIGRRVSAVSQSCSRASAYLVGAGLASANSALCSGNSFSLSARAVA